ncbi:MAG: hypothetical protein LBG97_06665 [Coriobacteriales bacterium]|jgi:hypothetical protein|nr:hypothetical protein [Coriobacteriales bacterium]
MPDLIVSDEEFSEYIQLMIAFAVAAEASISRYLATMQDVTATAVKGGIVSERLQVFTQGLQAATYQSLDSASLLIAARLRAFLSDINEKDRYLY